MLVLMFHHKPEGSELLNEQDEIRNCNGELMNLYMVFRLVVRV